MSVAKRLIARTLLSKIYANDKCARSYYSTVPCGPSDSSEWKKARRPKLPQYIKSGVVHYELAVEEDLDKILSFINSEIIPASPLFTSLGAKPEDLSDFYLPIIERTLKDNCSLLGFRSDELVAISLNSIKIMTPSSDSPPNAVEIIPSKDYGPMIEAASFKTRAAKKVHVFTELLRSKLEKLLPSSKKVMFIEIGGVKAQFKGRGISHEMVKHSMQLAREQFHCDDICTIADSKAAQKMFEQKLGYKLLRELKLDYFFDGPSQVFFCEEISSGKLLAKKL